jgi:hypothetical protein
VPSARATRRADVSGLLAYGPKEGAKKVIVCGTRTFDDWHLFKETLDRLTAPFPDVIICHGGQRLKIGYKKWVGADYFADRWASLRMKTQMVWHANWSLGKRAGPMRNRLMAKEVGKRGRLIAFWDGASPGTKNMIEEAEEVGIKTKVIIYEED